MAKIKSSFPNMLIALFAVTFIASGALGLVNEFTKDDIVKANELKKNMAISKVLPAHNKLGESFKISPTYGKDSVEVYPALDQNGKVVANAVKTYTYNGFSGYIAVMVGFDTKGVITGYQVLKHAETPGLGSKMNDWFSDKEKQTQNIVGKSPSNYTMKVAKDGGDVDAITAATISSRAFLESINRAYMALNKKYNGYTSATQQAGE